jgi:undecaprenyl-diphosphatase
VAPALKLRHAVVLGLAQGPAELLPVSSSAHTNLIPLLAGWDYPADAQLRKSFEVALHAGAGLALAVEMRRELIGEAMRGDRRQLAVIAFSTVPPAAAGFALEGLIERRLGGPGSIAAGLLIGAGAMAVADARPAAGTRRREEAALADGLALGLAQMAALIPGVSRSGAALTVARARGFARPDAHALSRRAALPVILGASILKGGRLARRRRPPGAGRAFAAGAAAAFLSTLVSARLLDRTRLEEASLLPYALYRCLLGATVARRVLADR